MDRKGFLLASETLKIVVAVICIAFLIYFLTSLYYSKTGADKLQKAEDSLRNVNDIISALQEGMSQRQDIPNPKSWYLLSFIEEEKPNSCAGNNCLCICKAVSEYGFKEKILRQTKKCDEKGTCIVVPELMSSVEIEIRGTENLNFILIKKQNEKILITED